jgi:hypothetical protein
MSDNGASRAAQLFAFVPDKVAILLFAVSLIAYPVAGNAQQCAPTVPGQFTGWRASNSQNISPAIAQYEAGSWEELKTLAEEATVAYYIASGWQSFQMTYAGCYRLHTTQAVAFRR